MLQWSDKNNGLDEKEEDVEEGEEDVNVVVFKFDVLLYFRLKSKIIL